MESNEKKVVPFPGREAEPQQQQLVSPEMRTLLQQYARGELTGGQIPDSVRECHKLWYGHLAGQEK